MTPKIRSEFSNFASNFLYFAIIVYMPNKFIFDAENCNEILCIINFYVQNCSAAFKLLCKKF